MAMKTIHTSKLVKAMFWRCALFSDLVRFIDLFGMDAGSFSELPWYDGVCNFTSSLSQYKSSSMAGYIFWLFEYQVRHE